MFQMELNVLLTCKLTLPATGSTKIKLLKEEPLAPFSASAELDLFVVLLLFSSPSCRPPHFFVSVTLGFFPFLSLFFFSYFIIMTDIVLLCIIKAIIQFQTNIAPSYLSSLEANSNCCLVRTIGVSNTSFL